MQKIQEYSNQVIGNINILYSITIPFDRSVDMQRLCHVIENNIENNKGEIF